MSRQSIPFLSAAIAIAAISGCATSKPVQEAKAAYPTGHVASSVLLVERDLPAEIVSGQEFSYDMKVTNVGHEPLESVALRDECASTMTLIRSEPAPASPKPPFVWMLGSMKPNESKTVHVTGTLAGTELFTSCASATYSSSLCLTAPVVEPALKVTISAPAEVTPCDTIPVRLAVANSGTGEARDVRLAFPLPEGWTTVDGKNSAQFVVERLAPKQSREFIVNVKASKTGDFASKASVTAWPAVKVESEPVPTAVRQAVLALTAEGPTTVYAGHPAVFMFSLTNTGTAPATTAVIAAPVPTGARFVSATENGKFEAGKVKWNLPTIPVKETREFSMTLQPEALGTLDTGATAEAYCAKPVSQKVSVPVRGIPAMLLEVTDVLDPVELGSATEYDIVITNQGSAPATNVKIIATLEDAQEFLSVAGGTAKVTGNVITFGTIPTIAPKAKVTLRVSVTCIKDSDVRFKVSMTADQLDRPVEETESTHIYR